MDLIKAEIFKKEADSIISKLFYFGGNRYEDAVDKYIKAGKIYKILKKYDLAVECMIKESNCHRKLKNDFDEYATYYEIASTYSNFDKQQSLFYYNKAISYYIENGKYEKLAKIHNEVATIYESFGNNELCSENLLKAGDYLFDGDQKTSSVKYYEKLADIYIILEKYSDSILILEKILDIFRNRHSYLLTKYIFKILVCYMTIFTKENNINGFENKLNSIINNYIAFRNSEEHTLLLSLIIAFKNNNKNDYSKLLKDYDYLKNLDSYYVKLFREIKNNLINEYVDNNIDFT